jgi:hypothetical protein
MREGQKACSQNKKTGSEGNAAKEILSKKFCQRNFERVSLIPAIYFAPGTLRCEGEKEESE